MGIREHSRGSKQREDATKDTGKMLTIYQGGNNWEGQVHRMRKGDTKLSTTHREQETRKIKQETKRNTETQARHMRRQAHRRS